MSKEIKLKAWDKVKSEMCDVMGIDFIQNMILCFPITRRTARAGKWRPLDEFELMEFTGLHDKNSKEIYEGDVVHYVYKPGEWYWNQDCIGIIKWGSTGFKMEPLPGEGGIYSWLVSIPGAMEPSCRELFEIIGNEFDGVTKCEP